MSTIRQFANYIKLAPSFRVSSVTNNTVIMKGGFTEDKYETYNDVEPTEEINAKSAGNLYKFQVKVYIDKLTNAEKDIYANNAPVIITLLDAETTDKLIVGIPDKPATISFIAGINLDQLIIEYTSKTPVL